MSSWIARLTWPGVEGALVLGRDMKFRAEGGAGEDAQALRTFLGAAEVHADEYVASPAEGEPGYPLARDVAVALGAEAEYAPLPAERPGVIY